MENTRLKYTGSDSKLAETQLQGDMLDLWSNKRDDQNMYGLIRIGFCMLDTESNKRAR